MMLGVLSLEVDNDFISKSSFIPGFCHDSMQTQKNMVLQKMDSEQATRNFINKIQSDLHECS